MKIATPEKTINTQRSDNRKKCCQNPKEKM